MIKILKVLSIILILAFIFVLIFSPIIIFISVFKTQPISQNITDWGAMGDYIGGITNPIISLLSLFILGYLTYLVSKISVKENKNLYLLQKKIEAYDKLMEQGKHFNVIPEKVAQYINRSITKMKADENPSMNTIENETNEVRKLFDFYIEFHNFLYLFHVRYSHLFHYNFRSIEYQELIASSLKLKTEFTRLLDVLLTLDTKYKQDDFSDILQEFGDIYVDFLNNLREELS